MVPELVWIMGSTILISLLSFVGILTISLNKKLLEKIILWLVGLSAGALIGGALIHLIPEAYEGLGSNTFIAVVIGFSFFFLIERILHWRHCHHGVCEVHTFTHMTLFGDGLHNFIDGLIIAAAYVIDIKLGIITTIAIIVHEIPTELGDFAVLIHGGYTKSKALFYNFISSLTALVGALIGFFIAGVAGPLTLYLLPFAAGGFIYVAAADLIPEIHKETNLKKSIMSFIFFIIGVSFMIIIKALFE